MTWPVALILVVGVLALGGGVVWLINRANRRAEDAETAAAVQRAKTLDIQAREARARAMEKYKPMTDEQIEREANELAERIRRDKERAP